MVWHGLSCLIQHCLVHASPHTTLPRTSSCHKLRYDTNPWSAEALKMPPISMLHSSTPKSQESPVYTVVLRYYRVPWRIDSRGKVESAKLVCSLHLLLTDRRAALAGARSHSRIPESLLKSFPIHHQAITDGRLEPQPLLHAKKTSTNEVSRLDRSSRTGLTRTDRFRSGALLSVADSTSPIRHVGLRQST